MSTTKLANVGNSKGVIIPKRLLKKYGISEHIAIVEAEAGILITQAKNPREGWGIAFKQAVETGQYETITSDILDDDIMEDY